MSTKNPARRRLSQRSGRSGQSSQRRTVQSAKAPVLKKWPTVAHRTGQIPAPGQVSSISRPRRKRWNDCGSPKSDGCCQRLLKSLVESGVLKKETLAKPKVSPRKRLDCVAESMAAPDRILPQLIRLFSRFASRKKPGNAFERDVFSKLAKMSKADLRALKTGHTYFRKIGLLDHEGIFAQDVVGLDINVPISPDALTADILSEGVALGELLLPNRFPRPAPGKVRPWARISIDGNEPAQPWPWINVVNGIRTRDHIPPVPFGVYRTDEYDATCTPTFDPLTQSLELECVPKLPPCEVPEQTVTGQCLAVASSRPGQRVELEGFNFTSLACRVRLSGPINAIAGQQVIEIADVDVFGDTSTAALDSAGEVVFKDVTDKIGFDVPLLDSSGQLDIESGVYAVEVIVPNTVGFVDTWGASRPEFASNIAYLRVRPKENTTYQVWSDQIHCYQETQGEPLSDEVIVKAYPALFGENGYEELPSKRIDWDGADSGDTHQWNWPLLGSAAAPVQVSGGLVFGVVGWEVDSYDAFQDALLSYDAAFTRYWEIVWRGVSGVIAAAGGVQAILAIIGKLGPYWWIAVVAVIVVVVVILIVGLIWAAWAGPDRIFFEVFMQTEDDLYRLTHPLSPTPPATPTKTTATGLSVEVLPEPKTQFYLYSEERKYRCFQEQSTYGIRVNYLRRS